MKIIYLTIILLIFSLNVNATEKNKLIYKKEIVIIGLNFINPALVVGALVSQTSTIKKIISMVNFAYASSRGKSIAETAFSQSTNKNCLIENIRTKKDFCI